MKKVNVNRTWRQKKEKRSISPLPLHFAKPMLAVAVLNRQFIQFFKIGV